MNLERVRGVIEGHEVTFTNLDKVLWPALGITKGWLVSYYDAVAPALKDEARGAASGNRALLRLPGLAGLLLHRRAGDPSQRRGGDRKLGSRNN